VNKKTIKLIRLILGDLFGTIFGFFKYLWDTSFHCFRSNPIDAFISAWALVCFLIFVPILLITTLILTGGGEIGLSLVFVAMVSFMWFMMPMIAMAVFLIVVMPFLIGAGMIDSVAGYCKSLKKRINS
jgi:hypothetical protein